MATLTSTRFFSRALAGAGTLVILLGGAVTATAATFIVNTIDDHDDGLCNAADCTLREAINAANSGGGGTIAFAIPGGQTTITTTLAPLPVITAPVEIDGTTQASPAGTLGVTIDGGSIGGDGLVLG